MLAEKVDAHRKEVLRALGPIRLAAKFAFDHPQIVGGSGKLHDAMDVLKEFEERLGRVVEGLRRLENAS